MIMGKPCEIYSIIHEMISRDDNLLTVQDLCEIAGVSRSGYYYWLSTKDKRKQLEDNDKRDFNLILEAFKYRGYDKGIRGIHMRLLHMSPPVLMNTKKIRRLMKKYQLRCPIRKANPYRRISKAIKTNTIADNLVNREFEAHGPRKVLLTDITYIPFNGTHVYLSTIIDAYTKQVLAYQVSNSLEVDFVLDTVHILIEKYGIELSRETIIHSDQGCHYTSHKFIELIKDSDLRQSMSRRGNCWDNAPQESFFGHMKDEINISDIHDYEALKTKIDDWIDYYNNDRYIWKLRKLSPNEFYEYITTGIYPL
jgi:transposase InsO family protein